MKSFSRYLEDRYMGDGEDAIIGVVADYLEDKAKETDERYPYAKNAAERLRSAAREVRQIEFDD